MTPWGDPDLQGGWSYSTLTPLERPAELAGKEVFTDEEAAVFIEQTLYERNADRRDEDGSPGGIVNGTVQTSDLARAYNQFWWDRGTEIVGTKRTSLIVDPTDGKLPALTPDAKQRLADRAAVVARAAHGVEDRPLGERYPSAAHRAADDAGWPQQQHEAVPAARIRGDSYRADPRGSRHSPGVKPDLTSCRRSRYDVSIARVRSRFGFRKWPGILRMWRSNRSGGVR